MCVCVCVCARARACVYTDIDLDDHVAHLILGHAFMERREIRKGKEDVDDVNYQIHRLRVCLCVFVRVCVSYWPPPGTGA